MIDVVLVCYQIKLNIVLSMGVRGRSSTIIRISDHLTNRFILRYCNCLLFNWEEKTNFFFWKSCKLRTTIDKRVAEVHSYNEKFSLKVEFHEFQSHEFSIFTYFLCCFKCLILTFLLNVLRNCRRQFECDVSISDLRCSNFDMTFDLLNIWCCDIDPMRT